jgi:AAA domain-containing protein/primase-like protein
MTTINRDQVTNHLSLLLEKNSTVDGYLELRTFGDSNKSLEAHSYFIPTTYSPSQLEIVADWIQSEVDRGAGIFIGQNPRANQAGSKSDIHQMSAIFTDLDFYKKELSWETVKEAIDKLPVVPDLVLNSGRGAQVVYFVPPTEDKDQWKLVQKFLYLRLKDVGADRAVMNDEARVLRLAGTFNQKDPNNLKETKTESLFMRVTPITISDLFSELYIEDESSSTIKDTVQQLPDRIPEGGDGLFLEGRNKRLFSEGSELRRRGWSHEAILHALKGLNKIICDPPMDEAEVEKIAEQCAKYEKEKNLVPSNEEIKNLVQSFGSWTEVDTPEPPRILYGIYAGDSALVQAPHGSGKSTVLLNLVMSRAVGREYYPLTLGIDLDPIKVLYIDAENSDFFLKKDLKVMSQVLTEAEKELLKQNLYITVDREILGDSLNMSSDEHMSILEAHILKKGIQLVVVDTFGLGFHLNSENDNSELNRVVTRRIKKLTRKTGVAFLLVHHVSGKGSSKDADKDSRARGGSAIGNFARMIIDIEPVRLPNGDKVRDYVIISNPKDKVGEAFPDTTLKLNKDTRWYTVDTDYEPMTEDSLFEPVLALLDKQMTPYGLAELAKQKGLPVDEALAKKLCAKAAAMGMVKKSFSEYIPTAELHSRRIELAKRSIMADDSDPFTEMMPKRQPLALVPTPVVAEEDTDEEVSEDAYLESSLI